METESFRSRVASRKFMLMLLIFAFSTFLVAAPMAMALVGVKIGVLMTGGEYVSLIIGSYGIYSGANVVQKKIDQANNVNIGEGDL